MHLWLDGQIFELTQAYSASLLVYRVAGCCFLKSFDAPHLSLCPQFIYRRAAKKTHIHQTPKKNIMRKSNNNNNRNNTQISHKQNNRSKNTQNGLQLKQ